MLKEDPINANGIPAENPRNKIDIILKFVRFVTKLRGSFFNIIFNVLKHYWWAGLLSEVDLSSLIDSFCCCNL